MKSEFKEMMIYMGEYYKLNREVKSSIEKEWEREYRGSENGNFKSRVCIDDESILF